MSIKLLLVLILLKLINGRFPRTDICNCSWLPWGQWSPCSEMCGGGSQTREQIFGRKLYQGCESIADCDGSYIRTDKRLCNTACFNGGTFDIAVANNLGSCKCPLGTTGTCCEQDLANEDNQLSRHKRGVGDFFVCILTFFSCLWHKPRDSEPPNLVCREPRVHEYADPFQNYAKVSWKEPTAINDRTDGMIKPKRYGRGPGHIFTEGTTVITYSAKDKSGNEKQCQVHITVEVKRCPEPTPVTNGYYICHPVTEFVLGNWCQYGCYDGFELRGQDILTCEQNEKWSQNQPTCRPWVCPILPLIEGARLDCTHDNSFRSICTYNCNTGYDMPPHVSKTLICSKGKTWKKYGVQKCIDVESPRFSVCPNTSIHGTETGKNTSVIIWESPEVMDNSGDTIIATQKQGPQPGSKLTAGKYTITYGATDRDGNEAAECMFNVVVRDTRCPRLYPTPFVQISCPLGYRTGSICNMKCDPGKTIKGGSDVECLKSTKGMFGEWNWQGNQTSCISTHNCASLIPPKNGAIVCDNWLGGEFCQLQCKKGTDMAGVNWKKLLTCSKDGVWFPQPIIRPCRALHQSIHSLGMAAVYFFEGDCTDAATKAEIANNFIALMEKSYFTEACPDNTECNTENVHVTCGPSGRRRREIFNETTATMKLKLDIIISVQNQANLSFVEINRIYMELFEETKNILSENITMIFNDSSVTLVDIKNVGLRVDCPLGSIRSGRSLQCVECPEGTFYTSSNICETCGKDTYQDTAGELSCKHCPVGTITRSTGAMSISDCEDACLAGSYSIDGAIPCSPCEIGHYQPLSGKKNCHKCYGTQTTLAVGSPSNSECREFDIEFPNGHKMTAAYSFQNDSEITSFTLSFWIMSSDPWTEIDFNVSFRDRNDSVIWNLENLATVIDSNGFETDTNLFLPDTRWHHIRVDTYGSNIAAYLDGMKSNEDPFFGKHDTLLLNKISVHAGNGFRGSISQLNIWSQTTNLLPNRTCVPQNGGDILSWHDFGEAILNEAFIRIPSVCDDFDDCESLPCFHGNCTDDLHTFLCTCTDGFTGKQCETNLDDCTINMCMNNATCVDGVTTYTCACGTSFTGVFCEIEMVDGLWSEWGNWSECTTTCGDGQRRREHLCNNPTPDNGGKICAGENEQFIDCDNPECPTCPQLTAPGNGSLKCENNTDSLNCSISCDEGYDFDIAPLDVYFCGTQTFHEWNFQTSDNPERRLPKCSKIQVPENVTIDYSAHYANLYCNSPQIQSEARDNIIHKVHTFLREIPCVLQQTCSLELVHVISCGDSTRNRRDITSAGFALAISTAPHSGIVKDILLHLQEAFTKIQRAVENGTFTVSVLGDDYYLDPSMISVSGDVTCSPGLARVNYYCVPCGTGSYLHEQDCKLCDRDTYQDDDGQTSCIPCPEGKHTVGVGSTDARDCSVQDMPSRPEKINAIPIIAGVSSAAIVLLLIVAVIIRRRRFIHNLAVSKHVGFHPRNSQGTTINIRKRSKTRKLEFDKHDSGAELELVRISRVVD